MCFEVPTVGDRTPRSSFDCCHVICSRCDDEMFTRADDRCPVCRAERTRESIREQCVSNQVARNAAAAQRSGQRAADMGVLFFPVENISEFYLPYLLLERGERTSTEASAGGGTEESDPNSTVPPIDTVAAISNNPLVNSVVHGLLNPSSVPLPQFFQSVAELRGRGRLAYATSMRRRNQI